MTLAATRYSAWLLRTSHLGYAGAGYAQNGNSLTHWCWLYHC
jgi:hypothetical protein